MSKNFEKKNAVKIYCNETEQTFNSISEAARVLELDKSNISAMLHGRRLSVGGYTFRKLLGDEK